jgi:hypothetical protein
MAIGDFYSYTLQSCNPSSYPDIEDLCTTDVPSPFSGLVVYIVGAYLNPATGQLEQEDQFKTYLVVSNGTNTDICQGNMPTLSTTNLKTCADSIADKMYQVQDCDDKELFRDVLLPSTYSLGTILRFTGEDTCWKVIQNISSYNESLTVSASFSDCAACIAAVVSGICEYEERTIGYANMLEFPKAEPIDRGFQECCVSNIVLADLADSDPYKNDFTSVFYKRQTPNDTVTYEIIPNSTGVPVALVDGVHGTLYAYGGAEQPDLSYFRVEWRDVLSAIGEDIFTIRMVVSIAGVPTNIDSLVTYDLRSFTQSLANNTVRFDAKLDGKLVKIDVDFKNSGYENSIRLPGYFGDRQAGITQDNVVFSSKKGYSYFEDQITMSNDWEYTYQANQIQECLARPLLEELIWGNEIFISDYNTNNHDYRYELKPVILSDVSDINYQVRSRKIDVNLTFKDRTKDNRKTNC